MLKSIAFVIVILFATPALGVVPSVSDDDFLVPEGVSTEAPNEVTKEQVRFDLAVLVRMLAEGYGGYRFLPDGQGPALVERVPSKKL